MLASGDLGASRLQPGDIHVLVYGHRSFQLAPSGFLRAFAARLDRLPSIPSHDDLVDLLVDFGEAESAVADARQPETDDEIADLAKWRTALSALASAVCASWRADADAVRRALGALKAAVAALEVASQPDEVSARVAEGFAQYGLYPEQYIEAASIFADALRPACVMCIGLRSIGATLAAVVAAALNCAGVAATFRTLRPRGHPWDRHVTMTPALTLAIARSGASHFAIVDEGPGISGSSFAAAVDGLVSSGIARDRIVLFPSWHAPASSLKSGRARALWPQHPQFVATFESTWLAHGRLAGAEPLQDLSGGQWRRILFGDDGAIWPAVQPQHERRKYLRSTSGTPTLWRFSGLGRHGRAKLARATALAEAGFGPAPERLCHGFMVREWIDGTPLRSLDTAATAARLAEYLAFIHRTFPGERRARTTDLAEMIRHNIAVDTEGRKVDSAPARDRANAAASGAALDEIIGAADAFDEPEVAVDGRLLPQEWIAASGRLLKVDALDHHADDFLPGCRDIAWDVAGALVESDFDGSGRDALVGDYVRRSGDRAIGRRLPFYLAAYAAYRLGYVTLAADVLGESDDGRRFRAAATRYRRSLGALARPRG